MMIDRFDTLSLPARSAFPDMARRPRRSWRHRNRRCLCDAQVGADHAAEGCFQVEWLSVATEEMEEAA